MTGAPPLSPPQPLAGFDAADIERLLDRAFGLDRYGRTAYRLRAGTAPLARLCFGVRASGTGLVGSIQAWPVQLSADSATVPMVMIGPVAVDPDWQGRGIGKALMTATLAAADADPSDGADALMLIGDPEYYGRFHGFTAERTGQWTLPGPFDRHRLLARGAGVPAMSGNVGPRLSPGR